MQIIHIEDAAKTAALHQVHRRCFQPGDAEYWREQDIRTCLAQSSGSGALVLQDEVRPANPWGAAWFRQVADECEILSFCVDPAYQRQGIGRRMLQFILSASMQRAIRVWFLEVRANNFPAISLYRSAGFSIIGHRRNYYRDTQGRMEDAVTMRLSV